MVPRFMPAGIRRVLRWKRGWGEGGRSDGDDRWMIWVLCVLLVLLFG